VVITDKYTPEVVGDVLDISVHSVSREFMRILLLALSKLPNDVVEWAADNTYFVSSIEADAFYKSKKELTPWKRGIIVLCEGLKNKSLDEQTFTIAHEIAHAKLNHKTASAPIGHNLQKHEKEADRLARRWLKR
jgi:Zn-dependent protease with chaperone function